MKANVARKATKCIVVPWPDGKRWRVGSGTSASVYDVIRLSSGKLWCSCRSNSMCSHIVATEHLENERLAQMEALVA